MYRFSNFIPKRYLSIAYNTLDRKKMENLSPKVCGINVSGCIAEQAFFFEKRLAKEISLRQREERKSQGLNKMVAKLTDEVERLRIELKKQ